MRFIKSHNLFESIIVNVMYNNKNIVVLFNKDTALNTSTLSL